MSDNTILNPGVGGDVIITEARPSDGYKIPVSKIRTGAEDFDGGDVTVNNPFPVAFGSAGTLDIFAQTVVSQRLGQVQAQFFSAAPDILVNVTTTGGATTSQGIGVGTFSSGISASSQITATTFTNVSYSAHYEIYAAMTASFTTPTSQNSYQRIGIYDNYNGFSFGYNGTTFGIWLRYNSTDTFVEQSAWNTDTLSGAAGSNFTRNGIPEELNTVDINLYRVRFGWLGIAPISFEILSPDGNFIVVHLQKFPDNQTNTSITGPNLPITLDIKKESADSTDLIISSGCWVAGVSTSNTPTFSGIGTIWPVYAPPTYSNYILIPAEGLAGLIFNIIGTWSGTLYFEYSIDGNIWHEDSVLDAGKNIFITSTTYNQSYQTNISGFRQYRIINRIGSGFTGSANIIYSCSDKPPILKAQTLITDANNNGPVTVKTGNIPATITDSALVVAISPNSPIPAQGNTNYYPNPANLIPNDYNIGINVDNGGSLMTRGPVITDEGTFYDHFVDGCVGIVVTGNITFINGSTIVTGTSVDFTQGSTLVLEKQYIKLNIDGEIAYTQVLSVNSPTRITLVNNYPGTGGTGSMTVSNWITNAGTNGSISVGDSNVYITNGLDAGTNTYIYHSLDYSPIQMINYMQVLDYPSSPIDGYQIITFGFQDNPASVTQQAIVQIDNSLPPNQIYFVTSGSGGSVDTTIQLITLPSGFLVTDLLTYKLYLGVDRAFLSVGIPNTSNTTVIAQAELDIPDPYTVMFAVLGIQNSATITHSATISSDAIFVGDYDRLEISTSFIGDPISTLLYGKNNVTGLINNVAVNTDGSLSITQVGSSIPNQNTIAANNYNTVLLTSNLLRRGATIFNDSSSTLYLILGNIATTTSFTVKINGNGYYETPFNYNGPISGIWSGTDGYARITELE